MIATIVYSNTANEDDHHCRGYYPNVNEYHDITMLRSKIIDLQYFLYKPDYIFVEFDGYVYNATIFDSEETQKLLKNIDEWIKEHLLK